jgi:hypothetical protein
MDGLGFVEWEDGFSFNNIPETIINRAYHCFIESIDGGPINHTHQDVSSTVVIRVFFKGYAQAVQAIDDSIDACEDIVFDICKVANRTSTLLNVVFDSCDFNPINELDDNAVLMEMRFTARVILGIEES